MGLNFSRKNLLEICGHFLSVEKYTLNRARHSVPNNSVFIYNLPIKKVKLQINKGSFSTEYLVQGIIAFRYDSNNY